MSIDSDRIGVVGAGRPAGMNAAGQSAAAAGSPAMTSPCAGSTVQLTGRHRVVTSHLPPQARHLVRLPALLRRVGLDALPGCTAEREPLTGGDRDPRHPRSHLRGAMNL